MTTEIVTHDDVDPDTLRAIEVAVAAALAGCRLEEVRVMLGGHSGVTLRGMLSRPGGLVDEVVIKMAPPGRTPIGRHDVLRQARILADLEGRSHLAVPEILLMGDGDPNFFAMRFVKGQSAEPVLDGPDLDAEEADARFRAAARMLARLHESPLDLPVLAAEPVASLADELARWKRLMDAVPTELVPSAATLHQLLDRQLPDALAPVLVHGDYRVGNTLCELGEVKAIIDWEIWSVGDPRVDLGWFHLFCSAENFPGASTPAVGVPSPAELLAEYEAVAGRSLPEMGWFEAFASYKMAAIMGHNLRRHREGRHHDPYQETLVPTILGLVDHGLAVMGVETTNEDGAAHD